MAVYQYHLHHLSQILNTNIDDATVGQIGENAISDFFDTIAQAAIATNGHRWNKKPILGLLWHLNDLLPACRQKVETYITAKWCEYGAKPVDKPELSEASEPESRSARSPSAALSYDALTSEVPSPEAPKKNPTQYASADRFLRPTLDPDWFDRFTDWVAAVVSLFKR